MKKKPRFFCDNCNYEVGSEVKSCPYCGRYFASIRCPSCDYSGPDRMFQNGCPMCGYSAAPMNVKMNPVKSSRGYEQHYEKHINPWTIIVSVILLLFFLAFFSWFITR
ncbi:MAG: zinc ribbon domain-containing protein [Treponema sp.]|nr:zinc ribbon domain-containing protein [Treponema sp.]